MYGYDDPEFYDIEIKRLQEDVRFCEERIGGVDQKKKTIWGFIPSPTAELECFNKQNRKRTLTAICAASSQQVIGAAFVIGNATYFLLLIGIKNYFDASMALYVIMLLSSAAAFPLSEMIGRRTLIVPSQFVLVFFLLLIGIMGCIPNKVASGWAIVVFIYMWAIVYQVSIGATGFVLASEVASLKLRAVTQSLVTMSNGVWGLIMQFTIPYMVQNSPLPLSPSTKPHNRASSIDTNVDTDQPWCRTPRRQSRLYFLRSRPYSVHSGLLPIPRD